jgi:hypothetical protein
MRSAWRGGLLVGLVMTGLLTAALVDRTAADALTQVARDASGDAGISESARSWSLAVHDFDRDGRLDFLFGRHGDAAQIWHNTGASFRQVGAGEIPSGGDRHDCDWADVNRDHLQDIFCSVGAGKGTADRKSNQLYIQGPPGEFTEVAKEYGVTDPWGRGRQVAFLDVNHDEYPDLFVGNGYPRQDHHSSWNRVYLNVDGARFAKMRTRLHAEVGSRCVQAVDVDGDGWQDLLVCGQDRLKIYRNRRGRDFSSIGGRLGALATATSARLADLNGDGVFDLVAVLPGELLVQLGSAAGFGPAVRVTTLSAGRWVAVGDANGDGHLDVYVVQSCIHGVNQPDVLYLNDGAGGLAAASIPQADQGCGDVVATIDYDADGMDDFLVSNGKGQAHGLPAVGPLQLITLGTPGAA